jgi:kumamolisin
LLGALDSNEQLYITFILRSRPDGPPLPDQEHWRKTPPGKRTFLSPREFAEKYGASQADLDVVANFAASHGMTVVEKQVGPAVVVACGTAAQMNAAFGITLNRYESPRHVSKRPRRDGRHEKKHAEATTQVHRGFDGSVHIPAELAAIVTAVFGLDNRIVGGTNGTGDPSGSTSLDVPTLAQMYNFPNTGAANQTIALLALLSELTRLASSQRGRLHPGFRRLGYPPRRRICLQCQLGNLHWRDLHPLDHQFSFTALSRRSPVGRL